MNIIELKQALELLYKQITPKATGTIKQSKLITIIADLQNLIKSIEYPDKAKKINKLVNG